MKKIEMQMSRTRDSERRRRRLGSRTALTIAAARFPPQYHRPPPR